LTRSWKLEGKEKEKEKEKEKVNLNLLSNLERYTQHIIAQVSARFTHS